jgi:flagellin-specific chaperone FliS
MAKFWDKMTENKQSLNIEIQAIEALLNAPIKNMSTIYDFIKHRFLKWNHRQNFITLEQIKNDLGITDIIQKAKGEINRREKNKEVSHDEYILYAEFIINTIPITFFVFTNDSILFVEYDELVCQKKRDWRFVSENELPSHIINVIKNIINTISNLGYTISKFDNDYKYKIITNNGVALDIVEKIPKHADDIVNYLHHNSKGNLKDKAAILNRFYIEFESKYEKILLNYGHKNLVSDIRYIANKFIRHGTKDKETTIVESFDDNKKEKWYDNLFSLYIAAFEIYESSKVQTEVDNLKEEMNTRTKILDKVQVL